jgi:hypothetical protein
MAILLDVSLSNNNVNRLTLTLYKRPDYRLDRSDSR